MTMVLKHIPSGRFIGFNYDRGLTELQEDEGPSSRDEIKELFPILKTITSWVEDPDDV